ncbi:hypothetical protein HETIRDRAFT_321869 [Heterobasidion irregulare TC 32-1]|uniref:Uncharacterized protein n=1 Tax=Heterobasidion irregulare (strain TC 32-1) TaxID=747525 RepID=W4K1L4_HETIT|nr:uncharacterized protein HETIRDRAFT_321869 [Heterobasidion irregulare TC 32-1]ETW79713.1 hypothetical protein HETIRDRAFT_321869 [Heterobasidion irregulare TC 32-1]
MQTATAFLAPPPLPTEAHGDPLRSSVGQLLKKAYALPCSTAAQAFAQLVQPSARFQLALDALLPLLDSPRTELSQRILVSYILYSLYAPHPIAINPFKSALYDTFMKEKNAAAQATSNGAVGENEQLVWVLWKVLKGDGNDIGPYSPSTLARSPLPPKLRATNLTLDEGILPESNSFDADALPSIIVEGVTHNSPHIPSNGVRTPIGPRVRTPVSNGSFQSPVTPEEDLRTQMLSQGMTLLLAARTRVLTLSEQRLVVPLVHQLTFPPIVTSIDLPPLIAHNPTLAHPLSVALLSQPPTKANPHGPITYLDVLARLPPSLPSFDLLGRLLRDTTTIMDVITGGRTTVADIVRADVLGRFIHESIQWLDKAESEGREGLISDDRFEKGLQNLCRFYNSLIKLGVVDPSSDADSTEMAHFTLRNSRFEEANALYRALALVRF